MSRVLPIKKIFIKRMIISTIIQFLIVAIGFIAIQNYIVSNEKKSIVNVLTINDSFSQQELIKYKVLENDYAFDLSLRGIADERKIDAMWFADSLESLSGKCSLVNKTPYKLCKGENGMYYGVTPLSFNHQVIGYVIASKKYGFFSAPIYYGLLIIFIAVISIFLFNFIFVFLSIKNSFEKNTQKLLEFISNQNNNELPAEINIQEYSQVAQSFIEKRNEISVLEREKCYNEATKNLAAQVAHDIRSPLAGLNAIVDKLKSEPEETRTLMRSLIQRVNDISNNLLTKYNQNYMNELQIELSLEPVAIMLNSILSEKRLQLGNSAENSSSKRISLQCHIHPKAHNAFIAVEPVEFNRVLSNLINNALEAISKDGQVSIYLTKENNLIIIDIQDNGCGIPKEQLAQVVQRGVSLNKKNGTGLGLSHAIEKITSWQGNYVLTSEVGQGTQFRIMLPEAESAPWFLPALKIAEQETIIILDDDEYVHHLWDKRFSEEPLKSQSLRLLHFYTADELTTYCQTHAIKKTLFLLDYELIGHIGSSLSLAQELGIVYQSILVTNRYDDIHLRTLCQRLGIKMIPKPFVADVSIKMAST